jgi:hypothetical protein
MFEIEYQGSRTCLSCAFLILIEAASSNAIEIGRFANIRVVVRANSHLKKMHSIIWFLPYLRNSKTPTSLFPGRTSHRCWNINVGNILSHALVVFFFFATWLVGNSYLDV